MTVTVNWDSGSKNVLLYHADVNWTWSEVMQAVRVGRSMMATVSHSVDIIADCTYLQSFSPNFMLQFKQIADTRPPNGGLIVFIGIPMYLRSLNKLFTAIFPASAARVVVHHADSLDEARAILAAHRSRTAGVG